MAEPVSGIGASERRWRVCLAPGIRHGTQMPSCKGIGGGGELGPKMGRTRALEGGEMGTKKGGELGHWRGRNKAQEREN